MLPKTLRAGTARGLPRHEHGFVGFQTNDDPGAMLAPLSQDTFTAQAAVAATLCLEFSTMTNEPSTTVAPLTINVGGVNSRVNLHRMTTRQIPTLRLKTPSSKTCTI